MTLATVLAAFLVSLTLIATPPTPASAGGGCEEKTAFRDFFLPQGCSVYGQYITLDFEILHSGTPSTGTVATCTSPTGCRGYANGLISGVKVSGESPETLVTRMKEAGYTRVSRIVWSGLDGFPGHFTAPDSLSTISSEEIICPGWCRIPQGQGVIGEKIILDNGRSCFRFDLCSRTKAEAGGWLFNGWINPQTWRTTTNGYSNYWGASKVKTTLPASNW